MSLDALMAALAEIPGRLATLEQQAADLARKVDAFADRLPPVLCSVPQAAAAFGVSVPTMRRWVKAHRVPVVPVGRTVRVDMSRVRGVDELRVARLAREAQAGGAKKRA